MVDAPASPEVQAAREKLRRHFLDIPADHGKQINGWNQLWESKTTPWDRGRPNPALVDALREKPDLTGSPFRDLEKRVRKKVLVPGCGRGYDVLLFASRGFDAYGIDASEAAVNRARESLAEDDKNRAFTEKDTDAGRGTARVILTNFFEDDFLSQTHKEGETPGFDVIYDYTFLCALPPALRPQWAKRMTQLLAPTGRLICLQHPLNKPPEVGGPPHGLSHQLYEQLLNHPGKEVEYDEKGVAIDKGNDRRAGDALVQLDRWKPAVTIEESPFAAEDRVCVFAHV